MENFDFNTLITPEQAVEAFNSILREELRKILSDHGVDPLQAGMIAARMVGTTKAFIIQTASHHAKSRPRATATTRYQTTTAGTKRNAICRFTKYSEPLTPSSLLHSRS